MERGDESGEDGRDFGGGWWRRRQCEAILSAVLESVGRGKTANQFSTRFIKYLEFLTSFKTDKKRNELPEKRRWRSLLGMYNLREIKDDPLQDDNKIIYENHKNNFISVCLSGSKSSAPQNILTSCRHIDIDAYIYIYIYIYIYLFIYLCNLYTI